MSLLKNRKKEILYIIISVILVILCSIFSYVFFKNKNINEVVNADNFYIDLDPIIVELKTPIAQDKKEYLKMNLTLLISSSTLNKKEKKDYILKHLPLIQDAIIVFFSSLSIFDFRDKRNFFYLKSELLSRINQIIDPYFIDDVLFKEFLSGN
ncbi:MAG: flagellar basal body-associated FliL family protein [Rickettsia sp.]|nr:flagellar basal body-associated FliL family protein [Rickettsia sp.]